MGLFNRLQRGIENAFNLTPKTYKIGEQFEDMVRQITFTEDYYTIVHKSHGYKQNSKDYVESTSFPDYKFRCLDTEKEFWVECKYRNIAKMIDEEEKEYQKLKKEGKSDEQIYKALEWKFRIKLGSKEQFTRFKKLTKENHLFYIVGLDYKDGKDFDILLIPMNELNINSISFYDIDELIIANNWAITPDRLWDTIYRMAVKKSYCIKCRKEIPANGGNELCFDCWGKWFKKSNFHEEGKYCHICGKEVEGIKVSKPMCKRCYIHTGELLFDKGIDKMLFR